MQRKQIEMGRKLRVTRSMGLRLEEGFKREEDFNREEDFEAVAAGCDSRTLNRQALRHIRLQTISQMNDMMIRHSLTTTVGEWSRWCINPLTEAADVPIAMTITVEVEGAPRGPAEEGEEGDPNLRRGVISAERGATPARGGTDNRSMTRQMKHQTLSREASGGTIVRKRICVAVPTTAASSRKFRFAKDVDNITTGGNGATRRMKKDSTPPDTGVKTERVAHP